MSTRTAADVWKEQMENAPRTDLREVLGMDKVNRGPLMPPDPVPLDPSRKEEELATMSNTNLVKIVAATPARVREVMGARPTAVGELIQQSLEAGRADVAQALMGGLKDAYRGGSQVQRELLFRSVMRVQGDGATAARDVMRTLVKEDDARVKPPKIPGVPQTPFVNPRLAALDAAEKDPATAKFRANFFDRPDEVANQMLEEARKDPRVFRKHMSSLTGLIAASPEAAKRVASSVMRLKGPAAREVNMWLLGKAYHAMDRDMNVMEHGQAGRGNGVRREARERAERIAPLLAQLASDPANARALVQRERMKETIPGANAHLSGVLARAFNDEWSWSTRAAVEQNINGGSAALLQESLDPARDHRTAETLDAARFIGTASCAESRNTKRTTGQAIEHRLAQAIPLLVERIPPVHPAASKAIQLAANGVVQQLEQASTPKPKMTDVSSKDMMLKVYKAVRPQPRKQDHETENQQYDEDSAEIQAWRGDYGEWKSDGANELSLAREECGK